MKNISICLILMSEDSMVRDQASLITPNRALYAQLKVRLLYSTILCVNSVDDLLCCSYTGT